MDPHDPHLKGAYTLLAAIAGAVTALSFQNWKAMTIREALMSLFVGASFAIFVTPLIVDRLLGTTEEASRMIAGLTYIAATGSNILIPMAIKWAGRVFGTGEPK